VLVLTSGSTWKKKKRSNKENISDELVVAIFIIPQPASHHDIFSRFPLSPHNHKKKGGEMVSLDLFVVLGDGSLELNPP
jgi:hypothetical protein